MTTIYPKNHDAWDWLPPKDNHADPDHLDGNRLKGDKNDKSRLWAYTITPGMVHED